MSVLVILVKKGIGLAAEVHTHRKESKAHASLPSPGLTDAGISTYLRHMMALLHNMPNFRLTKQTNRSLRAKPYQRRTAKTSLKKIGNLMMRQKKQIPVYALRRPSKQQTMNFAHTCTPGHHATTMTQEQSKRIRAYVCSRTWGLR